MSLTPRRISTLGPPAAGYRCSKVVDIVRGNLEALRDLDRALIDAGECDVPLVGRPPVAGAAVHFLLRDEFRHAVLDRAASVAGQRLLGMLREVIDLEILVPHIGDIAALRGNRRIRREARVGVGNSQQAHRERIFLRS